MLRPFSRLLVPARFPNDCECSLSRGPTRPLCLAVPGRTQPTGQGSAATQAGPSVTCARPCPGTHHARRLPDSRLPVTRRRPSKCHPTPLGLCEWTLGPPAPTLQVGSCRRFKPARPAPSAGPQKPEAVQAAWRAGRRA